MTTVAETPVSDATVPAVSLDSLDEFVQGVVKNLRDTVVPQLNAAANAVKAASGDPLAVKEALRSNPPAEAKDATKVANWLKETMAKVEQARLDLDGLLEPYVQAAIDDAAKGGEGAKAKYDELSGNYTAGVKYLKTMPNGEAILTLLPEVKRIRTSSGTTNSSAGKMRVRDYDFTVDGTLITSKNAQNVEVSSMSAVAKHLDVSVDDLRELFTGAVGGEAVASGDRNKWPASVDFTISTDVKDAEGKATGERKTHAIVATRRAANANVTSDATPQEVAGS